MDALSRTAHHDRVYQVELLFFVNLCWGEAAFIEAHGYLHADGLFPFLRQDPVLSSLSLPHINLHICDHHLRMAKANREETHRLWGWTRDTRGSLDI